MFKAIRKRKINEVSQEKQGDSETVDVYEHIKNALQSDTLETEVSTTIRDMKTSNIDAVAVWRWENGLLWHKSF